MDQLSFTLPSFAKLNWNLRVLGKRPDGYHEVRTVLQIISLHDELRFEHAAANEIVLSCTDPEIPTDENNLIVKAAQSLRSRFPTSAGAHILLSKNIPAKGGLGGGSSNAAVALWGLTKLWGLDATIDQLREIAAETGADVPFFLMGGSVLATGTGTTLQPLPDREQKHLVVVTPNASVATATAYEALNCAALTTSEAELILAVSRNEARFLDSNQWDRDIELGNDFERVIFDREPEIERAKSSLLIAGARDALLAGSGSSVFGIFDNLDAQTRALGLIEAEAGWRVFPCVTMTRNEYSRALGF